jgi:glycosyltransferase involved in cell wall biosynthesis
MATVTVIIPAYNEAPRLPAVLATVQAARCVQEILVVDDGSTDETTAVATAHGVRVVRLAENQGKANALRAGAVQARGEILLFLDADLRGLQAAQVEALVNPVRAQHAAMTIGLFRGGRMATDLAQVISPNISGQRCLQREFFLSVPLLDGCRSGVEIAITVYARAAKLPITLVPLEGVTHVMKEEKIGYLPGLLARWRMYGEILLTLARYHLAARSLHRTSMGTD